MINWSHRAIARSSLRARRACLAACAIAITAASLTPADAFKPVSFLAENGDKIMHAAMYAVLTLSIGAAWQTPSHPQSRPALAALVASIYGLLMEFLQGCLPMLHRSFSLADGGANALGAAVGALLLRRILELHLNPVRTERWSM